MFQLEKTRTSEVLASDERDALAVTKQRLLDEIDDLKSRMSALQQEKIQQIDACYNLNIFHN